MSQQLALPLGIAFNGTDRRRDELISKWRDRISLAFEDIDINNPEHVAFLNCQGMTFATIEKIFGVPHTSAHAKSRAIAPENRHFSLINVVTREYLRSSRISKKDKDQIREWLNKNKQKLLASKGKYYTRIQEDTLNRWESYDVDLDLIADERGQDDETECF